VAPTGQPNEFCVTYTITADNSMGEAPSYYDVIDNPMYGAGTNINNILVAYGNETDGLQGNLTMSPALTGGLIVDDEILQAGQIETFTVKVTFTIDMNVITPEEADCVETTGGTAGTGVLNEVVVTDGTPEMRDSVCEPIPLPAVDIVKTVSIEPTMIPGMPGFFSMQYTVDISSVGEVIAFYDLVDSFKFAGAIDPTLVVVTYDAGNTDGQQGSLALPAFDGEVNHLIVSDEPIEVGETERWIIDLEFEVIASLIVQSEIDCSLDGGENGTGLFNCANVEGGVPYEVDTACAEVPCFLAVTCPDPVLGTFTCDDVPPIATTIEEFTDIDGISLIGDLPCGTVVVSGEDEEWGPFCAEQDIERTYIIFDDLNDDGIQDSDEEADTCYQTYTILESPWNIMGVPADVTLTCGTELPAWPEVTASDDCGSIIPMDRTQVRGCASCGGDFFIRTWTATDECGNSRTRDQTIRFSDDVPPVLTVPADTILQCGDEVPEPSHIVTDECSSVSVNFSEERTELGPCSFRLVRTWIARDGCGNATTESQTIESHDDQAPTVTMVNPMLAGIENGGTIIMQGCDEPQVVMADAVFEDCCTAPLIVEPFDVLIASFVCDVFGYHRRWKCGYNVTDASGNTTEFFFYVEQHDNDAPIFENIPEDIEVECNGLVPLAPEMIATDACSNVEILMTQSLIGDSTSADGYAIARTWTAIDDCGNAATHTQMITFCGFDPDGIVAELGNTVWMDANLNGLQDSTEHGVNNVKVYLYEDTDGTLDNAELIDSSITVSIDGLTGQYGFSNLNPGDYMLRFQPDSGLIYTGQDVGDNDELDSDVRQSDGMIVGITLQPGESLIHLDAGLINPSSALPVELASFDLDVSDCGANLDWSTSSEINVEAYEVERSSDGISFVKVESISAVGNSSTLQTYSYVDEALDQSYYYRLRMVDLDGSYEYSRIHYAQIDCDQELEISVFPNPTQGIINLRFDFQYDLEYTLISELGQMLTKGKLPQGAGQGEVFDLVGVPSGAYMLRVTSGPEVKTFRIIKQ